MSSVFRTLSSLHVFSFAEGIALLRLLALHASQLPISMGVKVGQQICLLSPLCCFAWLLVTDSDCTSAQYSGHRQALTLALVLLCLVAGHAQELHRASGYRQHMF